MPQLQPAELEALTSQLNAAFPTTDVFRETLPEALRSWADNNLPHGQEKALFVANVLRYASDNRQIEELLWTLHGRTAHHGLLDLIEGKDWFADDQRQRIKQQRNGQPRIPTPESPGVPGLGRRSAARAGDPSF
jgi:hypothetical protein